MLLLGDMYEPRRDVYDDYAYMHAYHDDDGEVEAGDAAARTGVMCGTRVL